MTKVIFYGIHCNLELQIFSRLQLTLTADLAETRESTLVLKSRALANRNVAFRCLLVSLDHKADLLIFIDEKNCSQTCVKGPNIALNDRTHLRATERHLSYGITQCYLPPDRGERAPSNIAIRLFRRLQRLILDTFF